MDNLTELINGPMRSEMLQLEVLFHRMIETIPLITFSAIVISFGLVILLAVLDCMFLKDNESQLINKEYKKEEQYHNSTRDGYSQQATSFYLNDTNAAA